MVHGIPLVPPVGSPGPVPGPRLALIGDEFSAMELNASVLDRLEVDDLEACERKCLQDEACVAMEFYVVGQHTQTGTNCKLIEEGPGQAGSGLGPQ